MGIDFSSDFQNQVAPNGSPEDPHPMANNSKPKSAGTFNDLVRVAPNLYRHTNKTYYGVKKIAGVRIVHCLKTPDSQIAKGRLTEWLGKITNADPNASNLRMAGLFARYRALAGDKKATREQNEAIMRRFERTFARGMDTPVAKVRPSDIAEWFKKNLNDLSGSSYNEYRRILARLFNLAVIDRIIPPPGIFVKQLIPRKREAKVVRNIPTAAEFEKILAEMRRRIEQKHKDAEGPDFTEFMGVVGVGQAEASTVELADIEADRINFIRVKTEKPFSIPIFANTRAFLDRFLEKRGRHPGPLFTIRDCSEAFDAAILNLQKKNPDLPRFTLRNLRSMRIVAWLDSGVDAKQVADWQGHSDGGKLIWERYSEVVRTNQKAYLDEQIARAEGRIVRFNAA